jgi:hypothetical protein
MKALKKNCTEDIRILLHHVFLGEGDLTPTSLQMERGNDDYKKGEGEQIEP